MALREPSEMTQSVSHTIGAAGAALAITVGGYLFSFTTICSSPTRLTLGFLWLVLPGLSAGDSLGLISSDRAALIGLALGAGVWFLIVRVAFWVFSRSNKLA